MKKSSKDERQYSETFSLFDALQNSAEAWVDTIFQQKNLAIESLNRSITIHNENQVKKMKLIVKINDEIEADNVRIMRLYEECKKTLEVLEKRLDNCMGENEDE